jgi:hypothetical protein
VDKGSGQTTHRVHVVHWFWGQMTEKQESQFQKLIGFVKQLPAQHNELEHQVEALEQLDLAEVNRELDDQIRAWLETVKQ